jgi:formylglycine-generating enzyme required for sulfatase activity
VQLRTVPETGGEVRVDGESAVALPVSELLLDKGKHELRISSPRFLEYVTTIEVAGRDQAQTVEAKLVPAWADVNIMTEPPGAEIRAGEVVLGVTPATVELLAGTQPIELYKSGYRTVRHAVNVVPGQAQELPVFRLEEAGGLIRISSTPAGAAVTVQEQFAGNTPLEYEVAKGRSYKVTATRPGYATASTTVTVADEPVMVDLTLEAKTGRLTIVAEPADAELYVDGKRAGNANQEIDLLAVPHSIEVRKAGYDSWSAQVTPKPGLPQRLDVRLRTPDQAAQAKIAGTTTTSQGQRLKLIAPGKFVMGAPRREQGRRPNEVQRSVDLQRRFYLAEREVTNKEYRAFRPQHTSGAEKYRELAGDNNPAVMLSWEDAAAYSNWLSDQEGLPRAYVQGATGLVLADPRTAGYRLPTEAEWEWVARFGAGAGERRYPWGDAMPPPANSGNYADSSAAAVASSTIGNYTDGYPVTAPVGSYPADRSGIYDLGGNAAEWVNDRYSVAAGTDAVLIDPAGTAEGQYHVIRGSGWRHASISELRMAYRDFGDRGRLDVGFRIARYLPDGD